MLAEMGDIYTQFTDFVTTLGMEAKDGILTVASDMSVSGNTTLNDVTITGTLAAGLIQINPLESSIDVLGASCYNSATEILNSELCTTQALYIQKESAGNVDIFNGKVVIEPNGNLNVEGTVTAKTVETQNLRIDPSTEMVGNAAIASGEKSVIIANTNVKSNSKIFVTPTSSTGGQALIVTEKKDGESFTISVDNIQTQEITFDWWIVEVK
jgi:hypothetical protein